MSPRKIRLVTDLIKKLKPVDAVARLPFVQKRAGEVVAKVIKSAIADAKNQGASDTDLIFKEIQVGEGPRLKRGRAASRGRWHPIRKRMAHIRVVLTTRAKSEIRNPKSETKTENPKVKNLKAKVQVKSEDKSKKKEEEK
ncbi:MAG: 50S ribosomal protein L22 [Candidatus Woesebacteria bacterium GW2011_GWB1_39_10]|uniref:50S ribosomal protein L22 n=2 Tax=Candidatus Woeseibacteriota TaxID=1752722 RepID=A0A0G0PRQ8_9BACT|nr:MAG: 50S ribosomal protein L22 [Candidatus Woesebacteria bacterium GW2011_GWB1_39_10]KKS91016.1 MAG: 50S ribosomal protein L22 [Candidatus Woesebacteria bacterium GW2011_GWA1_43_12]